MNVILLANYTHDEQESMQRYAGLLQRLLQEKGWHVDVIRPAPVFGRFWRSAHGLGKWLGYIDKFILFPRRLRHLIHRRKRVLEDSGPFLVHICDHSNAMYTRWLGDVPHLVTCHDLLAIQCARGLIPGQRTKWTGRILQNWILSSLRYARRVICVSDATRTDLLTLAPELQDRCITIENTLNYPFAPMPADQSDRHLSDLGCYDKRYLLHIGGGHWYKNREGVVRIFARVAGAQPDLHLIMAGQPPTESLRRLVDLAGLTSRVTFTGPVTGEQLCALYSRAEALLFPSLREGFGWPIIEAQACGCPVVTSDHSPMKDIAGPAALLADPGHPDDFSQRLLELLSEDTASRLRRKIEAQQHTRQFNPQSFLTRILAAYESIL